MYCASDTNKKQAHETRSTQQEAAYTSVPEISQALFDSLVTMADHTDIIFYNRPISLSQDTKKDIHTLLGFFQKGEVQLPKSCKADADIIFQSEGTIIADGKFYISAEGCRHIIFLKDNKPYCGVNMNDQGVTFYRNLLKSHRVQ